LGGTLYDNAARRLRPGCRHCRCRHCHNQLHHGAVLPAAVCARDQDGRAWLDRKAAERERTFQGQQRQQADEWRELRLERRLDAEPAHGGGQTKVAWAVKGGTISGKAAVFFNRAQLGKLFLPVSLFG